MTADDRASLTELRERFTATGRDASTRLRWMVEAALVRTAERVEAARLEVQRLVALGHELEQALEAAEDEPSDAAVPGQTKRRQQLDYIKGTNDPLAGL